jgi:hypothetical protein
MKKQNWVWMPHAGHFICGHMCRFHLNTYVGKYIVSTVGELWFERPIREIHASIFDKKWFAENAHRKGDDFDSAYMKRFGYEELGMGRIYETMVFKAKRDKVNTCCPWSMVSGELDMDGYKDSNSAYKGHIKMCEKWSKK